MRVAISRPDSAMAEEQATSASLSPSSKLSLRGGAAKVRDQSSRRLAPQFH
ncbi:MAG: hypothetical protein R3C56_24315 [Pirellulaceae bacterium]